jgi:hypothetical protein
VNDDTTTKSAFPARQKWISIKHYTRTNDQ